MTELLSNQQNRIGVAVLLTLCWIASLLMPAFWGSFSSVPGHREALDGMLVLLLGWIGVLGGNFAWCANIMLFPTLVLLIWERPHPAFVWCSAALLVGFSLFALPYLGDALAGYYVWMAVNLIAAISAIAAVSLPAPWAPDESEQE